MPIIPPLDGAGEPTVIVWWISADAATGLEAPTSASAVVPAFVIVAYAADVPAVAEVERAHAPVTLIPSGGGVAAEEHAASSATVARRTTSRSGIRVRRGACMAVSDVQRAGRLGGS